MKQYDMTDDELENKIKTPYEIQLPNGTSLIMKNEKSGKSKLIKHYPKPSANKLSGNGDKVGNMLNSNKSDTPSNIKSSKVNTATSNYMERVTVAEIKGKYDPAIMQLQSKIDDKMDYLVNHAREEYSIKKQNGKSSSYPYMYNKYLKALDALEEQNSIMFNGIMDSLEKSLETNGFNKAYSKSFRDEYEIHQELRRKKVLNKAITK